ncbi:hypothetical protein JZ751_020311 [Albula glossodonta]|uniref:Nucleoporin NUP42 n=1 Tax=Albula glossodonta TaxID=121402 RepID=A0A8T2NNR4_9TELE|nr:hypothetical protein JZ751_020311 [Albula glossodonta]
MEGGDDPLEPSQTEKENKRQAAPTQCSSQAQHLCRFYSQGKHCQYGKRCRFLHQRVETKQTLKGVENQTNRAAELEECSDSQEALSMSEVPTDSDRLPKSTSGKKEKPKRPCRYFLSGYCAMEDRCRFWHPEQLPSIENQTGPKGRAAPVHRVPAVRPSVVQEAVKLSELTADIAKKLRETEISQLLKRIPEDQLIVQEREDGQLTYYRIAVQPTDPDWPFDLKEVDIMVSFPQTYPQEVFTVDVPEDQDLPAVMGRHLSQASQEWLQAKRATNELMGKVELLFRPFLRWLDRNMERLFTEGARQHGHNSMSPHLPTNDIRLKKDIDAERSGIRFVPYQQLQAAVCKEQTSQAESTDKHSDQGSSAASEEEDGAEGEEEEKGEDGVAHVQEQADSTRPVENVKTSDPRRGTEVRLQGLELGEETATVVARQITVTLQCSRCKVTADLTLTGKLPCTAQCEKCSSGISAGFRPSMLHHYSSVLGFLDLNGAVPVDLVLQDCELLVGCLACSKEGPLQLSYGQNKEVNCQHCHTKLRILVESTRFQLIQPRTRTQAGRGDAAHGSGRYPRDPAIQRGKPLPEKGTCKHYRQSHRWLRFSCCGRAYPCDVCHDEDQDHLMELATRMICGHCAKEQFFVIAWTCVHGHYTTMAPPAHALENQWNVSSKRTTKQYNKNNYTSVVSAAVRVRVRKAGPLGNGKPCISCGGMMTRGTYTSHWEGGQGCRNKVKMNRNDRQKYANMNKTVSRKATSEKK